MKKYYVIISIFAIIAILGLVFLFLNKKSSAANSTNTQLPSQQANINSAPLWNENFEEGNFTDLVLGKAVLVMGQNNSDGTVLANQILTANSKDVFEKVLGNFQRSNNPENRNNSSSSPVSPRTGGQNFNFQNLSPEERVKLREQRMANNGNNISPNLNRNNSGQARLRGEIINKDDNSLTLKLTDGGSKLIFFSQQTKILKYKE